MSDAYLGEIRMFGGAYAPVNWLLCDGQLLSIAEYSPLYSLLGDRYGGDGQTNFRLPDLRGRIPISMGQGPGLPTYTLGASGGSETVTLTESQMPIHTHQATANKEPGTEQGPAGAVWAATTRNIYYKGGANAVMSASAYTPTGGSQPHGNMMPYQCVNFIICCDGLYPTRS